MLNYEEITLSILPKKVGKVLDFGCGDGHFSMELNDKAGQVFGCDTDSNLLTRARRKYGGNIKFDLVNTEGRLPYRNNFFDSVIMLGVLEHVADEKTTLAEIWRIIKPGGSLYIYGINKGLFSFFDAANLKFVFPRFHKFLYSSMFSSKQYEREFVKKNETGMSGDFTLGKKWHTHYSISDLKKLLGNKFEIIRSIHFGLFVPFLLPVQFLFDIICPRGSDVIKKLVRIDQKISNSRLSYLFIIQGRKC